MVILATVHHRLDLQQRWLIRALLDSGDRPAQGGAVSRHSGFDLATQRAALAFQLHQHWPQLAAAHFWY